MAGSKRKHERRKRTQALLSDPGTLDAVCASVGGGSTLRDFCIANDVPFNDVQDWLTADEERNSRYKAALGKRDAHNRDVVVGQLVTMTTVDIAAAYGPNNTLLPVAEMPEDVRRAIASIKTVELFEGAGDQRRVVGQTVEVKLWDRNKSTETLARTLRMLTDKVEVDTKLTLEDLVAQANTSAAEPPGQRPAIPGPDDLI